MCQNSSGELVFQATYVNEGGVNSTHTGVFTCPVAGTYFFSVSLTKARRSNVSAVGCKFKRNGSNKQGMWIYSHDDANSDYDNSCVGSCSESQLFDSSTASFTGFLVKADP